MRGELLAAAEKSRVPMQMWQGRAQSRCRCGRSEPDPGADVARGEPSPGADVAGASPVPVQMWPVLGSDGCRRPMARSSSSRTATSSPARSTTSARACAPAQWPEQHACNHLAIGPRRRLVHRRSRSECARARPFAGDAQTSCDANGPARSAHDRKASRGPSHGPSSSLLAATAARSRIT